MLSWLFDTIELEDVVLVSVATLFAEPLLTSFDLSSSATALATLLAEPKFGSGASGAKLMGKCDRLVLETLRMGGGGGGFIAGGFGGGAAGRPETKIRKNYIFYNVYTKTTFHTYRIVLPR